MPPQQLGPYRLLRLVGRGGMGSVHAAENIETGDPAAVKVLAAAWSRDEGLRARFRAEIETLKQLRHEGIVRIFGYGESEEALYYAMELVEGANLDDELRRGRRFEWREVLDIGIQLAKALKCAHDHGVTHRDVKPSNLLIDSRGKVKLADFGIARIFGSESITSVGGVLGTAEYMAPEQVDGRPAGPLADLYSLGGVLYALLCGRPPFVADSLPRVLHLQRFAAPDPVRRHRPDCPAALEQVVLRLLDKDPSQRPQTALVLQRQLEAVADRVASEEQQGFTLQEPRPIDYDEAGPLADTRFAPTPKTERPNLRDAGWTQSGDADRTRAAGASGKENAPEEAFTVVRPDDEPPNSLEELRRVLANPQTWVLVIAASALAGFIYWASRPPSAEQIYQKLAKAREAGGEAALLEESAAMDEFLARFGDDPRADEVQAWADAAERERLRRRMRRGLRNQSSDGVAALVEEAFMSAEAYAEIDPAEGAAKFRSLIDLYDDGDATPREYADYVLLAKKRWRELAGMEDESAAARRAALRARLDKARETRATEPNQAIRLLSAMIALYGEMPWASDLVAEANAALEELQATTEDSLAAETAASGNLESAEPISETLE